MASFIDVAVVKVLTNCKRWLPSLMWLWKSVDKHECNEDTYCKILQYSKENPTNTLTQNELHTFIMGFSMHEKITPVPPNAGSGIQSCVRLFNLISWGLSL